MMHITYCVLCTVQIILRKYQEEEGEEEREQQQQ